MKVVERVLEKILCRIVSIDEMLCFIYLFIYFMKCFIYLEKDAGRVSC